MKKNFKFTIFGFQQERLLEAGLNSDDALVASVILDMYASEAIVSANIDGERYIWVSQRALQQYIPIVGSEAKVRRIINNLIDKGLLVKKIKNVKNSRSGCYTFVKPTLGMSLLTEYMHSKEDTESRPTAEPLIQNDKGVLVKMTKGPYAKCVNKDTPIKDTPIIDSNNVPAKAGTNYSEEFESWWSIYPRKIGKGKAYQVWKKKKLDSKVGELIEKLKMQNEYQYRFTDNDFIPHATTYLNGDRYDDEIEFKGNNNERRITNGNAGRIQELYESAVDAFSKVDPEDFDEPF